MVPVFSGFTAAFLAVDDVVVDAVLDVRGAVGDAEDALGVGLVLGEQQRDIALAVEVALAQLGDRRPATTLAAACPATCWSDRPVGAAVPGPLVAEPERRQDVQLGRLRAAVVDA